VRIEDTLHDLGVRLAQNQLSNNAPRESVVALLFGRPTFDAQFEEYGTSRWGHQTSLSDIVSLVQDFVIGYYNAQGTNRTNHVRVVVTTTNESVRIRNGSAPTNVMFLHGYHWGQMVNLLASWVVNQGYAGQVDVAAGNNIESGFNGFATTRLWIDGYASVAERYIYNIGAAYGYTQDNLWYLSWGSPPAQPFPQIYNASNASQWAHLSLYGVQHHNDSVIMSGSLTERGACNQYPDPTCPTPATAFTPSQGWQSLFDEMTTLGVPQTLPWSNDIRWCDTYYLNCYVRN
jgi:hypothetical protein